MSVAYCMSHFAFIVDFKREIRYESLFVNYSLS